MILRLFECLRTLVLMVFWPSTSSAVTSTSLWGIDYTPKNSVKGKRWIHILGRHTDIANFDLGFSPGRQGSSVSVQRSMNFWSKILGSPGKVVAMVVAFFAMVSTRVFDISTMRASVRKCDIQLLTSGQNWSALQVRRSPFNTPFANTAYG